MFAQVSRFRPGYSTKRQRKKHPLTGKLYCGGCGYAMVYKPLQGKNRYRRFECHKHALLKIPECCTYFSADILEELVLTMINKELMRRGEAAGQAASFDRQIHDGEEELLRLEEESERLEADMKQVIRFSHMEELTQELVDTFVKKIFVYKDKRVEFQGEIT